MIAQRCTAIESALKKHWPEILRPVRKERQRRDRRAPPSAAPSGGGHATRAHVAVDEEMADPQQQLRGRETSVTKEDTQERYLNLFVDSNFRTVIYCMSTCTVHTVQVLIAVPYKYGAL